MLSDAELREMERLVGVRSGLPKAQARQLITAYREATEKIGLLALMVAAHEQGVETPEQAHDLAVEVTRQRASRRKKNETLDTEAKD